MKYNIVFLDFDGVLNGSDWFSEITVKDEQTGIYKRTTESSILEYFSKEWIEKNNDYKIKITSFGKNISKYNMNNQNEDDSWNTLSSEIFEDDNKNLRRNFYGKQFFMKHGYMGDNQRLTPIAIEIHKYNKMRLDIRSGR